MPTYYGNFAATLESAGTSQNVRDRKDSVRAVTTAALPACTYANGTAGVGATLTANANGALANQDTVALVVGNRFGVKNQAATLQNGIYTVTQLGGAGTPWILTRATDADEAAEITSGMSFIVEEGSAANVGATYELTTANPITVGVTGLVFAVSSAHSGRTAAVTNGGAGNSGKIVVLDGDGKLEGRVVATDGTKLDGVEALADVTDKDNVRTALGLMDAEEGLNARRVARVVYDFTEDGGAVSTINLGALIPSACFVTRSYYQIVTPLTSDGAATCQLRYQNTAVPAYVDIVAEDVLGGAAWLGGGFKDGIQDGALANFGAAVQGAVGNIQLVIGTAALTAGKFALFVEYQRGTTP